MKIEMKIAHTLGFRMGGTLSEKKFFTLILSNNNNRGEGDGRDSDESLASLGHFVKKILSEEM